MRIGHINAISDRWSALSFLSALLVICATFVALPAWALSIREKRTRIAQSKDGKWSLVQVDRAGPEGGGSLAYQVAPTTPAGDDQKNPARSYVVSSTFSPGNGSKPQTISVAGCQKAANDLAAELVKTGFVGVAVNPENCREKERNRVVLVHAP
jgi:hypothetical protein